MRSFFHFVAYHATRISAQLLLAGVTRIFVLRRCNAREIGGAFILAANHISHFDPAIIAGVVRRKIDWMAMAEFFPTPVLGHILRAIECLPADRHRADRATIRAAIERLRGGRIVGMFPEGGIRDGANSVLEGAPLRPGVSTLAHIAKVPMLPCVILGSDRLYAKASWWPFRRTPIWVGFGELISPFPGMEKTEARNRTDQELAAAFRDLYAEMREKFSLTPDDLPQPPRNRMSR
jgi:1-acyl-sn-glycerol-3-phosphate acyltransferase